MHEYSIVSALMERVEAEADRHAGAIVHRLEVRLGELSGVDPELLATAFETIREGTRCAKASLELKRVAAKWICPACAQEIGKGEVLRCPRCGGPAKLLEGDEIILDRIEMEVPDDV